MKKFLAVLLSVATVLLVFAGCGNKTFTTSSDDKTAVDDSGKTTAKSTADDKFAKTVKFTMEDGQTFTVELYPEYAPKTVANFSKLVDSGFYDGLTFHRVYEGFMAQGGDPEGTGMGGSEETIPGEFAANGFTQNTLKHERGVISMARSNDPDSASSQFFICYEESSFLDGSYAAFGKVTEGMETIDSFLEVERSFNGERDAQGNQVFTKPITPIVIEHAEVLEWAN